MAIYPDNNLVNPLILPSPPIDPSGGRQLPSLGDLLARLGTTAQQKFNTLMGGDTARPGIAQGLYNSPLGQTAGALNLARPPNINAAITANNGQGVGQNYLFPSSKSVQPIVTGVEAQGAGVQPIAMGIKARQAELAPETMPGYPGGVKDVAPPKSTLKPSAKQVAADGAVTGAGGAQPGAVADTGEKNLAGWTEEQTRAITQATVGRAMSNAEFNSWSVAFSREHGGQMPWSAGSGPFDGNNNLLDHLIALGESQVTAEEQGHNLSEGQWLNAFDARYPGPFIMQSGLPGNYQRYREPGQAQASVYDPYYSPYAAGMPGQAAGPIYAPTAKVLSKFIGGSGQLARPYYQYQVRMHPEERPQQQVNNGQRAAPSQGGFGGPLSNIWR